MELGPADQINYYRLIPFLVEMQDKDAYQKYCHAMLDQFGETEDPVQAERTARSCLLLPINGPDLEAAAKLASLPVER